MPRTFESSEVGKCFSASSLSPTLLTHGSHQYVAYYNEDQNLTLAHRTIDTNDWERKTLPLNAKWDNHRGRPALAIDTQGMIHLSGNMHADPLVYWRSSRPHDIQSLACVDAMIGECESRVTYPKFMQLGDGRLTFWYRFGGSGQSEQLINVWDEAAKKWNRLLDQPLFDGCGEMGIYPSGPHRDALGRFHYVFMWRQSPDVRTNHYLSYVYSDNLVHWHNAAGDMVRLPITPQTQGVMVDPVSPSHGLINMHFGVGFDALHQPVVYYHKYDEAGNSQIYNARWEANQWCIYQTSDWDVRWSFEGGGAIPANVYAEPVQVIDDRHFSQPYHHWKYGSGVWKLDRNTLKPVGTLAGRGLEKPYSLLQVHDAFKHEDGSCMQIYWHEDIGHCDETGVGYVLRRESLPANRDAPRKGNLPNPTPLMLYKLNAVLLK